MPFVLSVVSEAGDRLGGLAISRDEYVFPGGVRVTIRADAAWCHACRSFVGAEHFPSVEALEHEAEEWFYTKYPEERTPFIRPMMRQLLLGQKRGMVERYRPMLDYLPHRQSPPRCLECGGSRFVRFEQWEHWYEHPEGGGRFRVMCNGHISVVSNDLYTPEGLRIQPRSYRRTAPL